MCRRTIHPASIPLLLTMAAALGCDPGAGGSVAPTLGQVVGRVDVGRLLECAAMSGSERARCLGASLLTTALNVAVDKAAELAERAKDAVNAGAGADDMTDAERNRLAAELDAALNEVGLEIAKAQPTE